MTRFCANLVALVIGIAGIALVVGVSVAVAEDPAGSACLCGEDLGVRLPPQA